MTPDKRFSSWILSLTDTSFASGAEPPSLVGPMAKMVVDPTNEVGQYQMTLAPK